MIIAYISYFYMDHQFKMATTTGHRITWNLMGKLFEIYISLKQLNC